MFTNCIYILTIEKHKLMQKSIIEGDLKFWEIVYSDRKACTMHMSKCIGSPSAAKMYNKSTEKISSRYVCQKSIGFTWCLKVDPQNHLLKIVKKIKNLQFILC